MNQLSSYIFSSKSGTRGHIRAAAILCFWVAVGLTAIDVLVNVVFAYPSDPKVLFPPRLQIYFEYGRSTDAQLARMTRADKAQTAPITLSGWYNPIVAEEKNESSNVPIITFYGMSHAVQLAHALGRVTHAFKARSVGAPGATANWAYGAFLRDRGGG